MNMKKIGIIIIALFLWNLMSGQNQDSTSQISSTEKILSDPGRLIIGGYGEVHYNQQLNSGIRNNGKLDVHRMVILMGYKFNSKTQFITEIEFEHVKEVYVEQAFLQYKISQGLNFRAGLLLIPVGLINLYHEPSNFHGVERPTIDKYIVPSTWREIGLGFNGNLLQADLNYQIYLVNGINGFDGTAKLSGSNGLRNGRQKGAESYISSPALTARIEHYGLPGLRLGLSAYFGKSQSSLFDGLEKSNTSMISRADSSTVGIGIIGLDARYQKKGFNLKGQIYGININNAEAYNQFALENTGLSTNLGSALYGYYLEFSYDVFRSFSKINTSLYPFIRYESYDSHFRVSENKVKDENLKGKIITAGMNYFAAKGAVYKMDLQFLQESSTEEFELIFNAGIGVVF